nr:HWE histidine kinase domain-containing protein [Sphingomicrobium sediminis]
MVLGLIAAVSDHPIEDPVLAKDILALFSGRAASELERISTASANERLGRIVESSISEAYIFDGTNYRFELVNRGARENLGYSPEELRALTPWDLKPDYSADEFKKYVEPLKSGAVPFLEFETIHERKDGSHYNVSVRLQYFGAPDNVFFASIADITERKMAEERERLLMREVNHRAKNLLSIIQVIARQTDADDIEKYKKSFERRIMALASSHDLLVQAPARGIALHELVEAQLGHFADLFGGRIQISGEPISLKPNAAQSIGMVLHELATNAAKYGALSNGTGRIAIRWKSFVAENGKDKFELGWIEEGGPEVVAPEKRGFGSIVIEKSLQSSIRGEVDLRFAREGLRFHVECSLCSVKDELGVPSVHE